MATKITPEVRSKIEARYKELTQQSFTTEPAPRALVQAAITRIYIRESQQPPTEFIWVDSDRAAAEVIRKNGQDPYMNNMWGQYDMYWLAKILVADEVLGNIIGKQQELFDDMLTLTKTGPWWPYEGVVVCCDTPEKLVLDAKDRLHCEDGPALKYRDGVQHWYLEGNMVTEAQVMDAKA